MPPDNPSPTVPPAEREAEPAAGRKAEPAAGRKAGSPAERTTGPLPRLANGPWAGPLADPPTEPATGPLAGLITGHIVSLTGNMLTLVALPLYVLAETGSATYTGLTGFVATVPVVLGGTFGSVLVDRFGHRRSSVAADLVGAGTMAAVPILHATAGLPIWGLLALVFVSGLLDSPGQTARHAMLPELAAGAGVPLERAAGWFAAADRSARLIGAPVAGLLVAAFGSPAVLAVDAATFAASALLIARLVPAAPRTAEALLTIPSTTASSTCPTTPTTPTTPTSPTSPTAPSTPAATTVSSTTAAPATTIRGYGQELREGLHFVARDPLLRAVILLVVVTNLFDAAKYSVILPVYADRVLGGPVAFGLLFGAVGGGALAGALAFGAVGHRLPRRLTFVAAFTLAGGPVYFAYAAQVPFAALMALTVVTGFCGGALNPIISVVELERVPLELRARVHGLTNAACWSAMPLGSLLAGVSVDALGLRTTLLVVGTCYLLVTLTPLRGGAWRELDRAGERRPVRAELQ